MKNDEAILTVSCQPAGHILLGIACCCFFLPGLPLFGKLECFWGIAAFCWLCGLIFLAFSIVYGKTYSFFSDRIEHSILGICFRKTAWRDITSVIRLYTGERNGTSTGFLFSVKSAVFLKQKNRMQLGKTPFDMCFKEKGFWHEWITGKHFFVQQFSAKQEVELLYILTDLYGKLDYDVRWENTGDGLPENNNGKSP